MKKKELKRQIRQLYAEIHTLVFEPESEHAKTIRTLCKFRDKQEKAREYMKGEIWKGMDDIIDMQRKINHAVITADLSRQGFFPKDVKNAEFDVTPTSEQIEVEKWRQNRIDGVVKIHESLCQDGGDYRKSIEKILTPEWCVFQLFDKGIITLEKYIAFKNKTDLEKIEFIDSFEPNK